MAILLAISLLGRIKDAKRVCILTPYKAQQALLDSLLMGPREVLGLSGMEPASRKRGSVFFGETTGAPGPWTVGFRRLVWRLGWPSLG